MIIDKAPQGGGWPNEWVRWFNQVYVALRDLIANFGTLQSNLTTLTSTVTTNAAAALQKASNLSDLANAATAQANLVGTWSTTWASVITGSGSMTTSGAAYTTRQWLRIGPWVFFQIHFTVTLAGTASGSVYVTLPTASIVGAYAPFTALVFVGGWAPCIGFLDYTTGKLRFDAPAAGVWANGSPSFSASGFYRCT